MLILILFISINLGLTAAKTIAVRSNNQTIGIPHNNTKTTAAPHTNNSTGKNSESKSGSNNNNNSNVDCKQLCHGNQNCIKKCEDYAKNPNRHPMSSPQCGLSKLSGEVSEFVIQELRKKTSKTLQPKWPWMVSLQYKRRMNQTSPEFRAHFCSGVIINENFVLSSAHCVPSQPGNYELMIGTNTLSVNDKNAQILEIEAGFVPGLLYKPWVIKHEDYDQESALGNNDLLLIKTAKKIETKLIDNEFVVNPICLPEPNYKPEGIAIIAGWGYTGVNMDLISTMVETDNPIIENDRADKVVKGTRHYFGDKGEYYIYNVTIADKDLCTMANLPPGLGDLDASVSNSTMYFGDSGSPLIRIIDNRAFDLGVAHWLSRGQNPISVWARLSSYTKWFEENMAKTIWQLNNKPKADKKPQQKKDKESKEPKGPKESSSESNSGSKLTTTKKPETNKPQSRAGRVRSLLVRTRSNSEPQNKKTTAAPHNNTSNNKRTSHQWSNRAKIRSNFD